LTKEMDLLKDATMKTFAPFSSRLAATSGALAALEMRVKGDLSEAVDANTCVQNDVNAIIIALFFSEGLSHLLSRVNHFVRSLLKVKELPADVNALAARVTTLDDSLAKLADAIGVDSGGNNGTIV